MKRLNTILTAAIAATLGAAALNPLPVDKDVLIGKLDNGLTYYIRHNERPANQVDFYLAQSVGSINEEENQRGLAHFLEHMCFNGTENFPGNSLIDYLESVGVKFGANLNAYTSTDRTVYNICQVPSTRSATVDSCLMIIRDWSGRLLLNDKDIDEERGVIKGEWRQRNGQASSRLLEKAAPKIYPASRYGERMPIGLMSVVENFKPKELRDYYHKWYHPQNQCVIVVGDIDPQAVEAGIKKLWADAKPGKMSVKSEPMTIADNEKIIVAVETDPEQGQTMVQMYLKHAGVADSLANTIAELRRETVASMVADMLAERFDEIENQPGAPFSNLGVGDMHFLLASNQPAFLLRAQAADGKAADVVDIMSTELKRAATHGFTSTEFERARLNARSGADERFAAAKSVTNTTYAKRYADHFLDGGALPSEEQLYKMMKGVVNTVSLEDANNFIREIVATESGRNVVLMCYAPEGKAPADDELKRAYESVDAASLAPYEDKFANRPLMVNEPQAGKIVSESVDSLFGNKVWTLSNGIKVNLKHVDSQTDKVHIAGKSLGGLSKVYDGKDIGNYIAVDHLLAVAKVGDNTATDLRKILAGSSAKSAVAIGKMEESVSASASAKDLRDAFRLIYLRSTDLRPDSMALKTFLANQEIKAKSRSSNATAAMGDSIHANVFDHHPLNSEHLHLQDLPAISYDRIIEIWADRFGDMSDFDFYIIGNFDEDEVRPLVEQYIASLPANGRYERPSDIGYHYASGRDRRRFTSPMETPQTIAYTFYNAPCEYNLENVIKAHIFGQIVQSRLREDIRERRGWTYGVKGHCGLSAGMNGDDPANVIMPVYIRVAPEHADSTFLIVGETVDALCKPGSITADELKKCAEYMAKNYSENDRDAGYWLTVLRMRDRFGEDMHSRYLDILNSVTPDDISAFGASHFPSANRLQLEMSPE